MKPPARPSPTFPNAPSSAASQAIMFAQPTADIRPALVNGAAGVVVNAAAVLGN